MSFYSNIILRNIANLNSSQDLKNQFRLYCDWCWGHGFGNCKICKQNYNKIYVPLRIREKQKELGLPITKKFSSLEGD